MNCYTASERSQLLKILSEANFASSFHHKSSQLDIMIKCYIVVSLGIDYQHLHQINTILNRCDLCWDLSFTATLQFVTPPNSNAQLLSLPDYYSVKVRVDTEHVIDSLMDNKEFSVAHDYARVVGAGSDVITVREVLSVYTMGYLLVNASQ